MTETATYCQKAKEQVSGYSWAKCQLSVEGPSTFAT